MRYPASDKLDVIRTVECSHLPTKQTLDMPGIPRTTLYRWYDLYLKGGLERLSDKPYGLIPFVTASLMHVAMI